MDMQKVSEAEKNRWGKIIETYLNTRKQLSAMIMLTDIRHKPTQQDIVMYQWICSMGKPHVIVATKADKIAKAHYDKHIAQIRLTLGLVPEIPVIPISSTKRLGLINVWNEIEKVVPGLEIVPDK